QTANFHHFIRATQMLQIAVGEKASQIVRDESPSVGCARIGPKFLRSRIRTHPISLPQIRAAHGDSALSAVLNWLTMVIHEENFNIPDRKSDGYSPARQCGMFINHRRADQTRLS